MDFSTIQSLLVDSDTAAKLTAVQQIPCIWIDKGKRKTFSFIKKRLFLIFQNPVHQSFWFFSNPNLLIISNFEKNLQSQPLPLKMRKYV